MNAGFFRNKPENGGDRSHNYYIASVAPELTGGFVQIAVALYVQLLVSPFAARQ